MARELIQTHADAGYDILKNVDYAIPVADIIRQHHERMDGSGYPRGLKGDDIRPEAPVLVVEDALESMASHRPYRPALAKVICPLKSNEKSDKAGLTITRGNGMVRGKAGIFNPKTHPTVERSKSGRRRRSPP